MASILKERQATFKRMFGVSTPERTRNVSFIFKNLETKKEKLLINVVRKCNFNRSNQDCNQAALDGQVVWLNFRKSVKLNLKNGSFESVL